MTVNGYMGQILFVNLTAGTHSIEQLPGGVVRKFIGGTGLSAYLLSKFPFGKLNPLGPENPLIFSTGPFTGTNIPSSGRFAVVAKSPLTGLWGESDSGGRFGIGLKAAGYDALVITGAAAQPVIFFISEEKIEIRPAGHLWGKDTFATHAILAGQTAPKAAIVCIGPAGEKRIPLANIISEGYHARVAGRCGLGAVMGAKNLKAVVVEGRLKPNIHDKKGIIEITRRIAPNILAKTKRMRDFGTSGGVGCNAELADMSAKNWTIGDWLEGAEKIDGEVIARNYVTGRYNCPTCIVGCGRTVRVTRGPHAGSRSGGPEYETIAGFGAQCLIADPELIIEVNDLCNRWGIDTISASGSLAFLFEAVEKGLIQAPKDYPALVWGNGEAVIFLLERMMDGRGLGKLLRSGVKAMAEKLGAGAKAFAMHVKGLELPYHDPRALSSLAVAYATHPRGACHRGCSHNLERFPVSELGYPRALDRFESSGKGKATALMQNYAEMYNCLKLCQFYMSGLAIADIVNWLNAVTGWNMDIAEFLRAGERSINLKRLLNLSAGLTVEMETAPPRVLAEPFRSGSAAGHLPDQAVMLREYYNSRGWDEKGVPPPETLERLGLDEIYTE